MALAKKLLLSQGQTSPPKSQHKKAVPESDLKPAYDRFMKTQVGSAQYHEAGDELMERVFCGK